MERPTALTVLNVLLDEVRDAIAECEEMGYHHLSGGTVEYLHYERLSLMEARAYAQIEKFLQVIRSARRQASADALGGYRSGGNHSERSPDVGGPDGGLGS